MKRVLLPFISVVICCALVQGQNPPALTIANIFAEGGLTGRGPETVKWSPDGKKVSYVLRDDSGEHGELWYIDVSTGKPAVLVAAEKLATLEPPVSKIQNERERERRTRYSVAGYHWAPDSKHLLFDANGQLWIYTLGTGTATQFTSAPEPSGDPKFSPDGSRLAYIRNHDLYVRPVNGKNETRLTVAKSGKKRSGNAVGGLSEENSGDILNGEVDWVYAEELDVRSNYFWSPDGTRIAYLQMDETKVPTYPIEDFIPVHPKIDDQKYPKAGDPNPVVRVGVVKASGGGTKWLKVTDDPDTYIPRFGWVRDGLVYIQLLNRAQTKLQLFFVDAESGKSRAVLTETSPNWIDVNDDFRVLKSSDRFLWTSWRDGHTHLYLYSFDKQNPLGGEAKLVRQLTHGDYEVLGVEAVDENTGTVYYNSNQGDARQRQLWSVKLDGGDPVQVTRELGSHGASFPENGGTYYVDTFSALMTPPSMSLCQVGGACTPFWQSRTLSAYNLIAPKFVDFQAEDGTVLHGMLLMPTDDVVQRAGGKVSLILNPYGGPGGQSVRDAWGGATFLFHQIMARRGFAILTVDNRGMAGRGQKFASALRRNFGELELKDQLTALEQALQRFPQLDRDRLGWWGWSYGGYMTLYALTHSQLFKAGVAVAPVTDWHDYDSIYTERYMGLPKENAQGYQHSSPVNSAAALHGFLLEVHGTSDDNVHMQNTIQMLNAFINAGKEVNVMLYPRKTHGIGGQAARTNLFTKIQRHFEQYLLGVPPKTADAVSAE